MLPRCRKRRQDGKEHLHKIVVENRCISAGRVLQRQQLGLDALWQRKLSLGRKGVRGLIFQRKAGRPPTFIPLRVHVAILVHTVHRGSLPSLACPV
jgi:hypothetical protein